MITVPDIIQIIEEWRTASVKLNNMILNDAEKEFDASAQISYGINANADLAIEDFRQVHGALKDNSFVITIRKEIERINEKADSILKLLSVSDQQE